MTKRMIETICSACDTPLRANNYEANELGIIDFWTCKVCFSDRVGCAHVERANFEPHAVHAALGGRSNYRGINIDSYEMIIKTYEAIEKHLKGDE